MDGSRQLWNSALPEGSGSLPWPVTVCPPGDFEKQSAILLGCNELEPEFPETMLDIIAELIDHIPLICLIRNEEQRRGLITQICDWGLPAHKLHFISLPLVAMWVRDFGPVFAKLSDGTPLVLDAEYYEPGRRGCDQLPLEIANFLRLPCARVPLLIDGGNILSNGRGLCLSTTMLLERNHGRGFDAQAIGQIMRQYYGVQTFAMLEPLTMEFTGHVDMFAAFLGHDTVVVGQFDPKIDPVNADLLDRNAEVISRLQTPGGRLRVVRIPMPTNRGDVWRTYTNVIFANGKLLVPSFPGLNDALERQAMDVYRQLLPDWEIIPVNSTRIIHHRGSLRCVSCNIPWMEHCFDWKTTLRGGGPVAA